MGTWGMGIFDDDTADDIRLDFEEAIEAGEDLAKVTQRVMQEYAYEFDEGESAAAVVYLAVASLQLEYKALQPEIREKALQIIASGIALDEWADEGTEKWFERKQVLETLQTNLLNFDPGAKQQKSKPKKKRSKIKPRIGDVFAISVDEKRYCFGQVITDTCCIIFNLVTEGFPSVEEIVNKPITFLVFTVFVDIEEGAWPVVGNISVREVQFPEYKIGSEFTSWRIINHESKILRPATDAEAERIPTRLSYSPSVLEGAVRWKFGSGEWHEWYEGMFYHCSDVGK